MRAENNGMGLRYTWVGRRVWMDGSKLVAYLASYFNNLCTKYYVEFIVHLSVGFY